ncbi:MAG: fumarylacetoacetate hydrolase family protein [Alphaproteobacteria bacterium]|jgi:2-keto-4-pentenoate hydratase/2-oxohepta-3-ene-1,7-dioic acid hydratase in catechol pathway
MKIVSYRHDGRTGYGVVAGDGIVDAGPRMGADFPSVRSVLAGDALGRLAEVTAGQTPDVAPADIEYLPPVTDPDMIICVGMNYHSAFEEIGKTFPGKPSLFMRRASAQVGHLQDLHKPASSDSYDCEIELAVIIGRPGRAIPTSEAMGHIAGYSVFNEASVTEWMRHTVQNVTPGKNFEGSGAFGPYMVTADEVGDPAELTLTHRLNGKVLQQGPVTDMAFSIPELIAYISTFTTLLPGDVISSGSPGGIRNRRQANVYVQAGDEIEMEIDRVGTLRNKVVEDANI